MRTDPGTLRSVAVIGSGISGMLTAHLLSQSRDVTLFEANSSLGGHTATVDVEDRAGRKLAVDSGFIVYNERTYPNFTKLLQRLGVATQPSTMSFSVRNEQTGLEYNGHTLNTLFAQRRNLLRPSFYGMIRDILRFNQDATALVDTPDTDETLEAFARRQGYSTMFVENYLLPMAAAIWSAGGGAVRAFPVHTLARFFRNHGMLTVDDRPEWRVLVGGSRSYIEPLTRPFAERIHVGTPVAGIRRDADAVVIECANGGGSRRFDAVVLATHSDTALRLLRDPSPEERELLGAIPYQPNDVVLHTDRSLMPKRRRAWAAWNVHVPRRGEEQETVAVTYDMNTLQSLDATDERFLVTLNRADCIAPDRVLRRFVYDHPVFTAAGIAAQARHAEISGVRRTYYCGAYWRYGFHEDGVVSALAVVDQFGEQGL